MVIFDRLRKKGRIHRKSTFFKFLWFFNAPRGYSYTRDRPVKVPIRRTWWNESWKIWETRWNKPATPGLVVHGAYHYTIHLLPRQNCLKRLRYRKTYLFILHINNFVNGDCLYIYNIYLLLVWGENQNFHHK